MEALQHAWPDLVLIQVFACEIDPAKQIWIHSVVNTHRTALGQGLVCIFTDISSLGSDTAHCHPHARLCRVPGCDVLVVGTSRKHLSKMTSNKFKHPVLSMQTSPGGTATTFRGLLTYLDSHSVDVVIYENSDNLDPQGGQGDQLATASNLDIFQSEMAARRFEGQNMLLNAKQFGSTASRRRFWSALFKTGGPHSSLEFGDRTLADIFSTFRALLKVCQRTPPTLEKVLLKSDDDVVERELLRRTALGKSDSSFSWIAEHQRLYANLRLQWGGGRLRHTLQPRVHGGSRLCLRTTNLCWCTGNTSSWLPVGMGTPSPRSNAESFRSAWASAQTATCRAHGGKMGRRSSLRACCQANCFGCIFVGTRSGSC